MHYFNTKLRIFIIYIISYIFENHPYILCMQKENRDAISQEDLATIRRNIALQRKKKGMTQEELAQKMGVTQRVISYYETQTATISLDAIAKIARALDIPKRKLLDTETEPDQATELPKAIQKQVDKIRTLSPKAQKTVADMIDALAKVQVSTDNPSK